MDFEDREEQKNFARRLRREMTDAERRLWYYLRGRRLGGCRFRRQRPMGPYFADFVCLERRLIVELDGGQHAEQTVEHDRERTRFLTEKGFAVLRFWDNEVFKNPAGVLETVRLALEERRPRAAITPPGS